MTGNAQLSPSWPAMSIAEAHRLLTAPGSPFEMETRTIRGQELRTYKLAPSSLREVFLASRAHGRLDFIVYEDERLDFDGHYRAVCRLASLLVADYGIAKGDRVVIAMRNLPEWSVAFWAIAIVGAIAVPLNAWLTGSELEYGLQDCGARLAIVDAERLERIAAHRERLPALERIVVTRAQADAARGATRWEDLLGCTAD